MSFAPVSELADRRWRTSGGVEVARRTERVAAESVRADLATALDTRRGLLISSGVTQDDRYRVMDIGYVNPPVEIVARGRQVRAQALNERGRILLPAIAAAWRSTLDLLVVADDHVSGIVPRTDELFCEEDRSRQPTVFTALRALIAHFAGPADPYFGIYGAFGYDLIFQFDPMALHQRREPDARDLVLHLPDVIDVVDQGVAYRIRYEFQVDGRHTAGLSHDTLAVPLVSGREPADARDHAEGEYASLVRVAQQRFRDGDMFEVVPGQCFRRAAHARPSEMFRRLRARNPAPYGLLANLGDGEHLVGTSPEMYVRVGLDRSVVSCPISGTIARGRDALEDAEQIRRLLNSTKEESELTMCTDVDRNDKARVCEPGSVKVLRRRQIELYSTLIHTSDLVTGTLREGRDALDAFLSHAWAVTVTGAPKRAAVAFIEQHERTPRRWYGGAFGWLGFDGTAETALTLRTIQLRNGIATIRAGATLLHDSEPEAEERETVLKALAMLDAVERPDIVDSPVAVPGLESGIRVLLVDHEDSFVQTLADYLRQAGADVITYRSGFPPAVLDTVAPDLVVLSPGPGTPADFGIADTLRETVDRRIPVFGVCLGLQGIVEFFGGRLSLLDTPAHGKPARVELVGSRGSLFAGLPLSFDAGRYHSLHADRVSLPECLEVTASTADGLVMAVEHRELPVAAVQFHPESIMTQRGGCGLAVMENVVTRLAARAWPAGVGDLRVAEVR